MKKIAVLLRIGIVIAIIGLLLCLFAFFLKLFADIRPIILSEREPNKASDYVNNEKQTQKDEGKEIGNYPDIQAINASANSVSGKVQWAVKFYDTNYEYSTESYKAPSASVIKVFIMEYIYDRVQNGELSLDEELRGSTVKDLLFSMITKSDNEATNVFIDRFGMESLNDFFKSRGYNDTKLERKMLDTDAMREGKDNYTSLKDTMRFLDNLYYNKDSYPYKEMLGIMKQQKVRTKIPAKIPNTAEVANKTGELNNVENDIGIIFTENGDFATVFLCSSLVDTSEARNFIKDASYMLYQASVK